MATRRPIHVVGRDSDHHLLEPAVHARFVAARRRRETFAQVGTWIGRHWWKGAIALVVLLTVVLGDAIRRPGEPWLPAMGLAAGMVLGMVSVVGAAMTGTSLPDPLDEWLWPPGTSRTPDPGRLPKGWRVPSGAERPLKVLSDLADSPHVDDDLYNETADLVWAYVEAVDAAADARKVRAPQHQELDQVADRLLTGIVDGVDLLAEADAAGRAAERAASTQLAAVRKQAEDERAFGPAVDRLSRLADRSAALSARAEALRAAQAEVADADGAGPAV